MHVHIGAIDAVILLCYLIIISTAWRLIASRLAEKDGLAKTFGEAMAFIL